MREAYKRHTRHTCVRRNNKGDLLACLASYIDNELGILTGSCWHSWCDSVKNKCYISWWHCCSFFKQQLCNHVNSHTHTYIRANPASSPPPSHCPTHTHTHRHRHTNTYSLSLTHTHTHIYTHTHTHTHTHAYILSLSLKLKTQCTHMWSLLWIACLFIWLVDWSDIWLVGRLVGCFLIFEGGGGGVYGTKHGILFLNSTFLTPCQVRQSGTELHDIYWYTYYRKM